MEASACEWEQRPPLDRRPEAAAQARQLQRTPPPPPLRESAPSDPDRRPPETAPPFGAPLRPNLPLPESVLPFAARQVPYHVQPNHRPLRKEQKRRNGPSESEKYSPRNNLQRHQKFATRPLREWGCHLLTQPAIHHRKEEGSPTLPPLRPDGRLVHALRCLPRERQD